jgi:hypothetical protein
MALRKQSFSKPQLAIFILVFALLGGVLIYRSLAASNPNLQGDLNNDNTVNAIDLSMLLSNYGTTNSAGDANSDGAVNAIDLSIVLSHYGGTYTPGSGEPSPIAGQGYHLDFSDDFNSFDSSIWADHIWYQSPIPNTVYAQNGELTVKTRRADGWKDSNASTGGKKTWTQGYFETRMKWTSSQGAWPAFWLFSQAQQNGTTSASLQTSEIDILEGDGTVSTGYNTALHKNTGDGFGIADQVCPSNNWHQDLGYGNITTDYHIYSLLWTTTTVTWYFDGHQIATCPVWANSTNQPMFLLLSMWPGGAISGRTTPSASGPAELTSLFDWVHVWQK